MPYDERTAVQFVAGPTFQLELEPQRRFQNTGGPRAGRGADIVPHQRTAEERCFARGITSRAGCLIGDLNLCSRNYRIGLIGQGSDHETGDCLTGRWGAEKCEGYG